MRRGTTGRVRRDPGDGGTPSTRREFLAVAGAVGAATIAGCSDESPTESDGDGGEEGSSRVYRVPADLPLPAQSQTNAFGPRHLGRDLLHYKLLQRSRVDGRPEPELLRDWQLEGDTLDVELFPDHYWWDGTNVTAEDIGLTFALEEYVFGDPFPQLDRVETTGDYTARFHLTDAFAEGHALQALLVGKLLHNRSFYGEKLESFEDASSEDEVDEIALDLLGLQVNETEPMYNVAFEMDSVGDATYSLSLRDDADPTPRFVSEINFDRVELLVMTGNGMQRFRSLFTDGRRPFYPDEIEGSLGFDAETVSLPPTESMGAFVFDCETPPTASRRFRRAWAYLVDREATLPDSMTVDETPTGVVSPWNEARLFEDAFLDGLEGYGVDEALREAAQEELVSGGFERDSEGNWLFADGDRAGEPMSFTVQAYFGPEARRPAGIGGAVQSLVDAMTDFGIDVEFFDRAPAPSEAVPEPSEFEIAFAYWGGPGLDPASIYRETFRGAEPAPGFPSTWTGPPVGSLDAERTEEYAVDTLLDGLEIAADAERDLERIAWVFNQGLPRLPVGYAPNRFHLNARDWDWPVPAEDNPGGWVAYPQEKHWSRGSVRSRE